MVTAIIYIKLRKNSKTPVWWAHTKWAPGFLWLSGIKLRIEGLENVDFSKTHFFVSNHQSFIDIPVIFAALPTRLHFVAKKEIRKIPIVGLYMASTGMLFLDRTNPQKALESLKEAGKLIKKGKSVITFPEGTRSPENQIGTFKKGSFFIAKEAGVPIVPIKIEGASKVWPARTSVPNKGKITIKIGRPITPIGNTNKEFIAFAASVRQAVLDL